MSPKVELSEGHWLRIRIPQNENIHDYLHTPLPQI